MPTDSFSPPQVKIGDMVYWYSDPLSCAEPSMGWVSQRPGAQTISVLVFTPYTGFQEKPSCRHRTDPGLQENVEWRQWGCWEFAPSTLQLRKLEGMMGQIAAATEHMALARKQDSGAKHR